MKGLKAWPIAAGVLIVLGGNLGAIIVLAIMILVVRSPREGAIGAVILSTPQLVAMLTFSVLFTATGGFVAAQTARTRHVPHGIAVGVSSLCIDLLFTWVFGAGDLPVWYDPVAYTATIPAATFGGYLARRGAKVVGRNGEIVVDKR
jgi:hypothetical protein